MKAAALLTCLIGLLVPPIRPSDPIRVDGQMPVLRANLMLTDYYVVWRYACQKQDGSGAGDCTISVHSQVSCQDAINTLQTMVQKNGDVCKHCPNSNITDNSKQMASGPERIT